MHAVATLACWSLLHLNFMSKKVQIVITNSEINYYHPVDCDFQVECLFPILEQWQYLIKMLKAKNKGRIPLTAKIYHQNKLCLSYKGTFAVIFN